MSKVSVLQVSTFYSELGGVEKSVCDLVAGLKETHAVSVLCTHKSSRSTRQDVQGVDVLSVGSSLTIEGRPLALTFPLKLGQQVVDVAHYHLPFPLATASHLLMPPKARVKVATWHHDLVRHPGLNRVLRPMMESFLDSLDKIIVTAPALIESSELLSKRRHKCVAIPLGIDDRRFIEKDEVAIAAARKKYGARFVLFVGRLVYYKGCEVLIRAMVGTEANLVIVGEGPQRTLLENLVSELHLQERVFFLGRQPDPQLHALYHACDVFALPSTLSTECFGLVQVEAMMCGKPVINTDLPTGVPWVSLHNQTGLTVPPSDPQALNAALKLLLGNLPLRTELGRNASKRSMEMFTLRKHSQSVAELYNNLLNNKKQPAPIRETVGAQT